MVCLTGYACSACHRRLVVPLTGGALTPGYPGSSLPSPQACALALLLCSFKSLADPHRRFGRGFVAAAAACVGLHTLNIALQVRRGRAGGL